jgi:hypothetical protein
MSMISHPVDPPGQARFLPNIIGAQFGACMASIAMHL